MNEWDALTDRGKARRLRPLVEDVLLAYGLQGARVRLIEVATNIVFRIDSPDTGPSFALKVDVEDDFPDSHRDIALGWLAAINADADIPVVELIKSVDGSNYVRADAPGVPPGRTCTMYNWVKRRTLFDDPTPLAYRQLGELTAQLHEHSSGYQPVGDPLRWDRVFYFPNEKYVVDDPAYGSKITDRQRDLVLECTEAVSPILAALYDHPGRLIHADLHGWNVNVYRGHLTLLDFDDVLWGTTRPGHCDHLWLPPRPCRLSGLARIVRGGISGLRRMAGNRLGGRRRSDDRPAPHVHQLRDEAARRLDREPG